MKLGNYNDLKRGLTAIFGDCYTDDNAVVLTNGDQSTVATLHVLRPDTVTVHRERKPAVDIHVRGACIETAADILYLPPSLKRRFRKSMEST